MKSNLIDPITKRPKASWKSWGSLVRVPNTLTAVADIFAGSAVAFGCANLQPELSSFLLSFVLVSCASIAFYWAGMVLNDVFDVEEDIKNRRPRPIPNGEIKLETAKRLGWLLIGIGIVFAAALPLTTSGYVRLFSWIPLAASIVLALCIFAYDGWLKSMWLAPWVMGLCRGANLFLGASLVLHNVETIEWSPMRPLAFLILGQVLYVSGFTWAARRESVQSSRQLLVFGWLTSFVGIGCLALVPQFAASNSSLYMDPYRLFPFFLCLLSFPLARRAWVACSSLNRMAVQASIKQAIMTIILLDAAATLEFIGPLYGSICCLMILPSLWMGAWFRST